MSGALPNAADGLPVTLEEGTETEDSHMVNPPQNNTIEEAGPRSEMCLMCKMLVGPPGSVWIQPCRCGFWVHDQCLVNVTMICEDLYPGTCIIGCRICRRRFNVSPSKSTFLKYAEKYSEVWYQSFCYLAMKTFFVLVFDVTFIKLGSLLVKQIYGPMEAARLVSSMHPMNAVLTCQMIPLSCIVISNIPWESRLLKVLRKCSRLPLVGGVFPFEDPGLPDIYKGSSDFAINALLGLFLPFFAMVTRRLFTGCVEDPFLRFLCGGATFVLIKGVCKMYYNQKKYARFCNLDIANYIPPNG